MKKIILSITVISILSTNAFSYTDTVQDSILDSHSSSIMNLGNEDSNLQSQITDNKSDLTSQSIDISGLESVDIYHQIQITDNKQLSDHNNVWLGLVQGKADLNQNDIIVNRDRIVLQSLRITNNELAISSFGARITTNESDIHTNELRLDLVEANDIVQDNRLDLIEPRLTQAHDYILDNGADILTNRTNINIVNDKVTSTNNRIDDIVFNELPDIRSDISDIHIKNAYQDNDITDTFDRNINTINAINTAFGSPTTDPLDLYDESEAKEPRELRQDYMDAQNVVITDNLTGLINKSNTNETGLVTTNIRIDNLETTANNNTSVNNTQQVEINDIKTALSTIGDTSQIATITTDVSDLKTRMTNNETLDNSQQIQIDNNTTNITNLSNRVDSVETVANNNTVTNDNQQVEINSNTVTNNTQQAEIDSNTSVNNTQQVEINDLENRMTNNENVDNSQQAEIDNNTSVNNTQQVEINNMNNKVTSIETAFTVIGDTDAINNLIPQVDSNTNNIAINRSLGIYNYNKNVEQDMRIDNNSRRIDNVENKVSELESYLMGDYQKVMDKKVAVGMASDVAMDFENGDRAFGMNIANFNGQTAYGLGFGWKVRDNAKIKVTGGYDMDANYGVKGSFSLSF
jgi:hypothetical protein